MGHQSHCVQAAGPGGQLELGRNGEPRPSGRISPPLEQRGQRCPKCPERNAQRRQTPTLLGEPHGCPTERGLPPPLAIKQGPGLCPGGRRRGGASWAGLSGGGRRRKRSPGVRRSISKWKPAQERLLSAALSRGSHLLAGEREPLGNEGADSAHRLKATSSPRAEAASGETGPNKLFLASYSALPQTLPGRIFHSGPGRGGGQTFFKPHAITAWPQTAG